MYDDVHSVPSPLAGPHDLTQRPPAVGLGAGPERAGGGADDGNRAAGVDDRTGGAGTESMMSEPDLPGVPLVLAIGGTLLLLVCGAVRTTVWLMTGV